MTKKKDSFNHEDNVNLLSKRNVYHTPWFNLIEKKFSNREQPFYSLEMKDYVTVIARTIDKRIILVSQYRHVLEKQTFEFPSGHIEEGENPSDAAIRELFEETGYFNKNIQFLGSLFSDTGRHENRIWCYWVDKVIQKNKNYLEKDSIEVHAKTKSQLYQMINSGNFCHALDIATLGLAKLKGKI